MLQRTFPLLLLTTALAPCQDDAITTRGSLSAMPFALSLPRTLQPGDLDQLLFKLSGDQTVHPSYPQYAVVPDFRFEAMFPMPSPPATDWRHRIDFASLSSGNDRIKYTDDGKVVGSGQGGWTCLVFGVRNSAVGNGGPIAARRSANLPVGSDVYSYMFGDSVGVAPALLGEPVLEIPGEAVALGGTVDMQAGDCVIPQIALTDATPSPLFTNTNRFFFTLTQESVVSLNSISPWPSLSPLDSGTIYELFWDGQLWQGPFVTMSRSSLGLQEVDEIDALGVHASAAHYSNGSWHRPPPTSVLLSLELNLNRVPQLDQILAVTGLIGAAPYVVKPLRDYLGEHAAEICKMSIFDDVDVIAAMDPDTFVFNRQIGTPIPNPFASRMPLLQTLGLSLATDRYNMAARSPGVWLNVSGWCGHTPERGLVALHFEDAPPMSVPLLTEPPVWLVLSRRDSDHTLPFFVPLLVAPHFVINPGVQSLYAEWGGISGARCSSYASAIMVK